MLSQSETMSQEYCCTIVKLGEILEIPNARTVAKTIVNGRTIVVDKSYKEGDVMIYCSNETQLNADFLYINNLYSRHYWSRNSNAQEIKEWYEQNIDATIDEQNDYLRHHTGYFDLKGRVRMQKLAGEISMGVLFPFELFQNWCPSLKNININDYIGQDFDTVNDVLFIKAYVPQVSYKRPRVGNNTKQKNIKEYDRMIPGQFTFHYDTTPFEKNIALFKPDDEITITNKLHGTSYIISNIKVKKPKWGGLYEKLFLYLPTFLQKTKNDYDVIYSSRTVIKNKNITNKKHKSYSIGLDVCFDKYYELLKDIMLPGMTFYGEIIGYEEGSNRFIQTVGQGYDYGCNPGENRLMIYRITATDEYGSKIELNVDEVHDFTVYLKSICEDLGYEEIAKRLLPIQIFYQGKMKDLYADLDTENHWHENFLERLKNDKKFGMEEDEIMCRNKVPREGVVIRKVDDPVAEAFKLKCLKFLGKEAKEMDKETLTDSEIDERYNN